MSTAFFCNNDSKKARITRSHPFLFPVAHPNSCGTPIDNHQGNMALDQMFWRWPAVLWLVITASILTSVAAISDVPSLESFARWSGPRVSVLGKYLYLEGGYIAQFENGELQPAAPLNSTVSIDLSTSWTTANAIRRAIPKPDEAPRRSLPAIWADTQTGNGAFYLWGGTVTSPLQANDSTDVLWKFTADGSGGGAWSNETPSIANPTLFASLHTTVGGLIVTANDTMGFHLGGVAANTTDFGRNGTNTRAIPGMVTFDMKTKTWFNGTYAFSRFDTFWGSTGEYLPTFGPGGLIMVLGGHEVDPRTRFEPGVHYPLDTVTLIDPVSKKKYQQATTGDIPPTPRAFPCSAGFASSEGSYEIFMYGGEDWGGRVAYQDAYVLSLPGFVWRRVPAPPMGPRKNHACVAVGKRQVLSVGGVNDTYYNTKDNAPQGLQVFDMTRLVWKDDYDAGAAEYVRADVIADWYKNGGLDNVYWSSREVESLFVRDGVPGTKNNGTSPDGNDPSGGSNVPVGAIAGGVVGGVVGLGIIGALVWWFLRRRSQKPKHHHEATQEEQTKPGFAAEQEKYTKPELAAEASTSYVQPLEIGSPSHYRELDSSDVARTTQQPATRFELSGS
ncbi:hypothetical protein B0T14DRAFT_517058 [Immersiella caudata]|uniref:Epidermal growth factor receptor-like transmembrane-juxtamembrane segment domain-containing protein n=1 Tax=Immersiella caudata TaxID=314043 RepID=A0AA39WY51_9PEZI|nr:hypothetical protein B0T14DRAFT_517058 [Immersiella caudata]